MKAEYRNRREARERFMQLLFQMEAQRDFRPEGKELFLAQYAEEKAPDAYFERLYTTVCEHLPEIDAALEKASANWKLSRIAWVDLAILRLSAGEILFLEDIPNSVSINEAVEMAKLFGEADSGKFVNGVLGNVAGKTDEV